MRQTKEETEQTRAALLGAAETLFWEQGAARSTVLNIAKTAGLTRGASAYRPDGRHPSPRRRFTTR